MESNLVYNLYINRYIKNANIHGTGKEDLLISGLGMLEKLEKYPDRGENYLVLTQRREPRSYKRSENIDYSTELLQDKSYEEVFELFDYSEDIYDYKHGYIRTNFYLYEDEVSNIVEKVVSIKFRETST